MIFAIVTYIEHQCEANLYNSYAPYIREMNLWFKHVEEVEIVAPLGAPVVKSGQVPFSNGEHLLGEPYKHSRISFTKIPSFHLLNFLAVLDALIKIPFIFFIILGAMRRADHIHLRCPGNISLVGCIAQLFFPRKPKTVKYAGNWGPKARQPWAYRLQKWILSNTFFSRNIKVLVYGDWPRQSKNIVPFFTASFSAHEKEITEKDFTSPYKFIYTGNLVEGKGVFEAIELIEVLNSKGINSELEIYGDGMLKDPLNNFIQKKNLQKLVKLKGRKSLEELKDAYKKSHFVVLLSKSEGWPKTVAEGMWYGCVPVATPVSCVPWMLNYGSRGILIPIEKRKRKRERRYILGYSESQKNRHSEWFQKTGGAVAEYLSRSGFSEADVERIVRILENPEKLEEMSSAAQQWSWQYTLEKFEAEIKKLLVPVKT